MANWHDYIFFGIVVLVIILWVAQWAEAAREREARQELEQLRHKFTYLNEDIYHD